ncbi:hypothetical protein T265_03741 [Opisthorchis viverrini]|uniref:Uncharacterized protein n=1 Tax=Opisthorchis viverrini TaxID=6198 RepID=A0A074ZRL9_OPIVI|nr:hypothetical protein T265_03741 [Opisthorchis viverrini]KER29726.1 hypothetical protein T265_03741 [Opisthorchis viverrini]
MSVAVDEDKRGESATSKVPIAAVFRSSTMGDAARCGNAFSCAMRTRTAYRSIKCDRPGAETRVANIHHSQQGTW